MNRLTASAMFLVLAISTGSAGQTATTQPAGGKKVLRFGKIEVDLTAREIRLQSKVCLREGQLELILCRTNSKEHESILHTDVQGSHLHAALLALGLAPGKAAEWNAMADGGNGALVPPRGARLNISLTWKDAKGKIRRAAAADWIAAAQEDKKAEMPTNWVFVGSDILDDGRYWADTDGDIISVSNFASAVIDVPFESSDKAALLSFKAKTTAIPPLKTPVTVTIKPLPNARKAPHARMTLRMGPKGEVFDGPNRIAMKDVPDRVEAFVENHSLGRVVVYPHPKTLTHDIALLQRELMSGGTRDIAIKHAFLRDGALPRTTSQLQKTMQEWKSKFDSAERQLIDPVGESAEVLRRIDAEMATAQRDLELLRQYRIQLQKARKHHIASIVQPADDAKPKPKSQR